MWFRKWFRKWRWQRKYPSCERLEIYLMISKALLNESDDPEAIVKMVSDMAAEAAARSTRERLGVAS